MGYICIISSKGGATTVNVLLTAICTGRSFRLGGYKLRVIPIGMPLVLQMLIGGVIITLLELISDCIINLILGWNVWDYSDVPFNFLGQICLYFSVAWYFISLIAIVLDDYLRYFIFHERKPHYKII